MRLSTIKLWGVLFLLPVFFQSCSYEDVEIRQIKDIQIGKIGPAGFDVEVVVELHNPNSYKITITESDLDIKLNGNAVGSAQLSEKIVLKSNETEDKVLKASAKFSDMQNINIGSLMSLLGGKATIEMEGTVTGKVWMFPKTMDVKHKENVRL